MVDDNLPTPRDDERVESLKRATERLDSPNNIPTQAFDVGDTDVRKNPRASDLGYAEQSCAVATNIGGTDHTMYDEENGDTRIDCDSETFIGDITEWS